MSRVAVVTDLTWIRTLARVSGVLVPAEIRVFDLARLDQARAWLSEARPSP